MRSGLRTHALAVASVLISLLLSLVALEAALRVYHQLKTWHERRTLPPVESRVLIPSRDPELIFEWNPGWNRDGFTVNSFGMPDRELPLAKPDGVFRIAVIGDSISANQGHRPRPEIFLNVLARNLEAQARAGLRFEVLNFGVNAYGVRQSVRMLETRALRFAPDLVIAQLCLNDPYPSSTPYASVTPAGPSRLWNFVFLRLWPTRFWASSFVAYGYDDEGVENVRRGLARLAEIGRRGPPVLAVLFPYFYAPAYDEWGFERYHEIYRAAAREAGLPLLDLYEPLRRAGFIVKPKPPADPIHPGADVHARVAAEIEAALDGLRMLPPATAMQPPAAAGSGE